MKLKLIAALISLLAMFAPAVPALAQSVQQEINNGLCAGSNLQITPDNGKCNNSQASNTINQFVHRVVNILSAVVGVVAVIMIIFGGFRYVTSGGNDTSVTSAKNTILYAIIGLIIVALSQILVHFTIKNLSS